LAALKKSRQQPREFLTRHVNRKWGDLSDEDRKEGTEQEADAVGRNERQVEERIKEMLEARIPGRNAVVWKQKSGEIPDKEPYFLVAYMPLDFGTQARV
jgi:hypothetical protein